MKFIRISIIAFSMGVLTIACNNNAHCPPSAADSSSTSAGSSAKPSDSSVAPVNVTGTSTEITTSTDTMAVNHNHRKNARGKHANDSTMANVKKREGNFTSGTGSDNPGR